MLTKHILLLLLSLYPSAIRCTRCRTAVMTKGETADHPNPIAAHAKTYKDLVTNSTMFVDNSLFIEGVLSSDAKTQLIVGPRESGKTLNVDMLKAFLEIPVNQRGERLGKKQIPQDWSYSLFNRGEVILDDGTVEKLDRPLLLSTNKELLRRYQGKIPVVYVTFKDVVGANYTEVEKSLRQAVAKSFEPHVYLFHAFEKMNRSDDFDDQYLAQIDHDDFEAALNGTRSYLENTLVFLCKVLYQTFDQNPFVIVDDYDMPFINIIRVPDFPPAETVKVFKLMETLLSYTFKRNDFFFKGIAVGTYKFQQERVLKAWNDYHLDDVVLKINPITEYFGFHHDIVGRLLDMRNVTATETQRVSAWYNGYLSLDTADKFYNTRSVANFLNQRKFTSGWRDEVVEIVLHRILHFQNQTKTIIFPLLSGQSLIIPAYSEFGPLTASQFQLNNIPQYPQIAIGHLYRTGYLAPIKYTDLALQLDVMAGVPNKEILSHLSQHVATHYQRFYHLQEKHLRDTADQLLKHIENHPHSDLVSLQSSLQHLYKESNFTTGPEQVPADLQDVRLIFTCVALKTQSLSGFNIDVFHDKIMDSDIVLANNHTKLGIVVQMGYNDDRTFENPSLNVASTYRTIFRNTTYNIEVVKLLDVRFSSQKNVHVEIFE